MNKVKYILIFVTSVFTIFISGCGNSYKKPKDQVKIYDIEITIASENDNHVYSGMFPYHYYKMEPENHRCALVDMSKDINKTISKEDFDLFYNFIEDRKAEDETKPEPAVKAFAYRVHLSYYDEDGKKKTEYYEGYNDFPDELNVLIDKFNELCMEEVLFYPTKLVEVTPDFIYREFGMTEADIPYDDLKELIVNSRMKFTALVAKPGNFDNYMKSYYLSLEADKIDNIIPTEIPEVNSVTDEDYNAFLSAFISKIGSDWELSDRISDNCLNVIVNKNTGARFLVGKAQDIVKFDTEIDNDIAWIYLDAGMENMTYGASIIFDKTNSYMLIDYNQIDNYSELVNAFYGE